MYSHGADAALPMSITEVTDKLDVDGLRAKDHRVHVQLHARHWAARGHAVACSHTETPRLLKRLLRHLPSMRRRQVERTAAAVALVVGA